MSGARRARSAPSQAANVSRKHERNRWFVPTTFLGSCRFRGRNDLVHRSDTLHGEMTTHVAPQRGRNDSVNSSSCQKSLTSQFTCTSPQPSTEQSFDFICDIAPTVSMFRHRCDCHVMHVSFVGVEKVRLSRRATEDTCK